VPFVRHGDGMKAIGKQMTETVVLAIEALGVYPVQPVHPA
jgi:hypothetical protein